MKKWETVIGLEIHAELNTSSKIYCSCKNEFGADPNTLICPVCIGLPGALPTLNEKVVEYAVKMGHALNCEINSVSQSARKNYFYPDLPKAYQISQAEKPICGKGYLDIPVGGERRKIGITRIHIEEDAGKLLHDGRYSSSLVDLNRCGVPLIEIVTEPDLRSTEEVHIFLTLIKSILLFLGISDCKMQEGSIRCDVNVSVHELGQPLGTRVEMKNVNSFSAALRGIEYESKRQTSILGSGGVIEQETRRWDDKKGVSIVMRSKENAQDYRYFPEPDLGIVSISPSKIKNIKNNIRELPNEKIFRYVENFGLSQSDAFNIACDIDKSDLFDECIRLNRCRPESIANWILGQISRFFNDTCQKLKDTPLTADKLSDIISAADSGKISSSGAKRLFEEIMNNGGEVEDIIERLGLEQCSDPEYIENLADKVIKMNQKSVYDYKNGKTNALGYLVGQAMKLSNGRTNPAKTVEIMKIKLEESL